MYFLVDDTCNQLRSEHVFGLLSHKILDYIFAIVFGGCDPSGARLFVEVGPVG